MAQSLTDDLPSIAQRIQNAGLLALFLDFDGTIADIVDDPSAAQLEPGVFEVLRRLCQRPGVVITIMSGRAVEDLFARIRLEGIVYSGNHGLEIFGRNLRFVEPLAAHRRDQLQRLVEALSARLASIPGVAIQDKGLTASIHFRKAALADIPEIEESVLDGVAACGERFRLNQSRMVLEIVPRTSWHKGVAAEWIVRRLGDGGVLPVYLGDDATDEDAFSVLRDAITIKVGSAPMTTARYRVPNPAAVQAFLEWLERQQTQRTMGAG